MQPPTHARDIRPTFAWELVESQGAVCINGSRVRQTLCLNALRSGDGIGSGVQLLRVSNKLCVNEPNQDTPASAGRDVVLCRQATPEPAGPNRRPGPDPVPPPATTTDTSSALPSGWPYTGSGARAPAVSIPMPSWTRVAPGPTHRPSGVFLFGSHRSTPSTHCATARHSSVRSRVACASAFNVASRSKSLP